MRFLQMASETKETVQTKTWSTKLEEWQRRNRRPLECVFNHRDKTGWWACSISMYDKAGVLLCCSAPTKSQAKEDASKQFFELKADELVTRAMEALPANTLKELCEKLSVPPCIYQQQEASAKLLEIGHTARLAAVALKCAEENKSKSERKKILDEENKQLTITRQSTEGWMQCTISHPLWSTKRTVSALGPNIKEAKRACEVRVLGRCMQDPDMFGTIIMPDSKGLQSAMRLMDHLEERKASIEVISPRDLEHMRTDTGAVGNMVARALQSDPKLPLGIDCEMAIEVKDGQSVSRVATVQVTNGDVIGIFRVHHLRETKDWPKQLLDLLNRPGQRRFGVDVEKDKRALELSGATLTNIEDLQKTASQFKEFGLKPSLAIMAARLCRLSVLKNSDKVRTSDWAAKDLSGKQIRYAALDALLTLLVGLALDQRKTVAAESDPQMYLHPDRTAPRKAGAAPTEDTIATPKSD